MRGAELRVLSSGEKEAAMNRFVTGGVVLVLLVFLAGCKEKPTPTQQAEFKNKKGDDEHGHDHDRGKMRLEDATLPGGKKGHAGLTAHLSKKQGNELDISFETMDKDPKPLTVPEKTKITARVTRKGDDKPYVITFEPAEKDERKSDPEGQCSRFSAKAPWMKHEDELTVTLTIEGVPQSVVWVDFNPKKYAHVDE
jgi:hypothetical protein